MKVITRQIPARVSTVYKCKKCKIGGRYKSKVKALKCETLPIEPKLFRVGDKVTWREKRTCQSYNKNYSLRGKVTKISGPMLPDEEYNLKWLGAELSNKHVFEYLVKWQCRYCKEKMDGLFYGMELIKLT